MKKIIYLKKLINFAYKYNPILMVFPFLSFASILSELLAMMMLIPLSILATNHELSAKDPIVKLFKFIDIVPNSKIMIIAFLILITFRIITNVITQHISLKYGKRVLAQLAAGAFQNIVKHCQLEQIEKKSIGHYISLAGDESFRASNIVIEIHQLITVLFLAGLYYGLICWYFPLVAISLVFFMAISYALMYSSFQKTHALGVLQINQSKSAATIFLDSLNGLRTVRSLFAEDFVVNEYQSKMKEYAKTLFKIDFISVLLKFSPIAILFSFIFMLIVSGCFDKYIGASTNTATIITAMLFLMRFFPVAGQGLNIMMRLISDYKAAQDVTEILNREEKYDLKPKKFFDEKIKQLKILDLKYSYLSSMPLFSNLNYEFEAGKSYAIVGSSGVGKSTFFNVLSFLIETQSGEIFVNNLNYRAFNRECLRKKVILVEQESIIFNESVRTNIALGNSYSIDTIADACKVACIDDFINQLPEKYDYILNYQGQNISGGQRQRIGIARAILRDPDVLLLL